MEIINKVSYSIRFSKYVGNDYDGSVVTVEIDAERVSTGPDATDEEIDMFCRTIFARGEAKGASGRGGHRIPMQDLEEVLSYVESISDRWTARFKTAVMEAKLSRGDAQ